MPNRRKEYPGAIEMYEMGLSLADVAAYTGVTRQSMWAWFRRRGIPMRGRTRSGAENHFHRDGTRSDKKAQRAVWKAIKKGILIRPTGCEECGGLTKFKNGRSGLEAHHADYNRPMDVRWLCRTCHHKWHEEQKAKPRRK